MTKLLYNYQSVIRFDKPVTNHSILLRCQPPQLKCQKVVEEHLIVSPDFRVQTDVDVLGNRMVYGSQMSPHLSLVYLSVGVIDQLPYIVEPDAIPLAVYGFPTFLTTLRERIVVKLTGRVLEDAMEICHVVHDSLVYVPHSTSVDTPAEQVWRQRKGVCQDYAHLMLAVCRQCGMVARYVCGFVIGTGETHAWVEVFDGYAWIGYDPTHDVKLQLGYVPIAHGRDAADCSVSRGVYQGHAMQQVTVSVSLEEFN